MAYFLLKLIAPRPSFALDMTPAERDLMFEHAGYWADMMKKGVAVAYGPVVEPDNSWGLGILEVADEAEARAHTKNDPAIKSQRDFRYEFYPMLTVISRASVPN